MNDLDFQILLMLYICDRTKLWTKSKFYQQCNILMEHLSKHHLFTYVHTAYLYIVVVSRICFCRYVGMSYGPWSYTFVCSKDRGITRITNTIRMVLVCSSVLHYYLVWMFWKMLSCELFFMIVFVESMSNCMINIQFVMIYIMLVRYIQVLRWNT